MPELYRCPTQSNACRSSAVRVKEYMAVPPDLARSSISLSSAPRPLVSARRCSAARTERSSWADDAHHRRPVCWKGVDAASAPGATADLHLDGDPGKGTKTISSPWRPLGNVTDSTSRRSPALPGAPAGQLLATTEPWVILALAIWSHVDWWDPCHGPAFRDPVGVRRPGVPIPRRPTRYSSGIDRAGVLARPGRWCHGRCGSNEK